jgi:hypothetical protein
VSLLACFLERPLARLVGGRGKRRQRGWQSLWQLEPAENAHQFWRTRYAGSDLLLAYHYTVFPRKDSNRVQLGNEIPPGGDVACNEDSEGEDGEWVHGSHQ